MTASQDIRWVLEKGKKHVTSSLVAYVRESPVGDLKGGFVVAKRIGSAVQRHQIKRWMRESFRQQKHLFQKARWWVFLAKTDQKVWKYEVILDEMGKLASMRVT
ncbi:MAG: ribonuclease P protein component [Chlamydiae bacterium]|nr:ribonuclease P protein component [Chlamydiota bacterium]